MKVPREVAKVAVGVVVVAGLVYAGLGVFTKPALAFGLCTPQACAEEMQDATAFCDLDHGGLEAFYCAFPGPLAHFTCNDGYEGTSECGQ